MKRILTFLTFILAPTIALACPECERKQLEVLKGVAHGAGPEQQWDYVIVGLTAVIVLISLFYATKWLIKPGEKGPSHIKREVLNFD